MRLIDIPPGKVKTGTNWVITFPEEEDDRANPFVRESSDFGDTDVGLFSSVMKMNDGSEHLALIIKNFEDGGLHTDTYIHTKDGWMNLFADGLTRILGRYHHDIFPFEIFVGRPWKKDRELLAEGQEKLEEHRKLFDEAVQKMASAAK